MNDTKHIAELFDRANFAIKASEYSTQVIPISAINELRYAGQHLAEAISSDEENRRNLNFRQAKSHCYRAIFDAYDAASIGLIYKIDSLVMANPSLASELKSSSEELSGILRKTSEARRWLLETKTAKYFDLEEKVRNYESIFNELDEAARKLFASQPILMDLAAKNRLKHLTAIKTWAAGLAGAVSLAVAIITFLMRA